jgi:hypothetical protein
VPAEAFVKQTESVWTAHFLLICGEIDATPVAAGALVAVVGTNVKRRGVR